MSNEARKEFDILVYGDHFEDAEGNPIDRALIELDKIQADIDAKYPKPTYPQSYKRMMKRAEEYVLHEQDKESGVSS